MFLKSILKPEVYHGHNKDAPFFEGWYYKLVSADEANKFAIIPGVFLGKDGYAFIQVLHGDTGHVEFFTYPLEEFSAAEDEFKIQINNSTFELDKIHLDIDQQDTRLKGKLEFTGVQGWPVSLLSPGVMGWYAWVPKMECYHGVLSFSHEIAGNIEINGASVDLTGGRGYMEKDWGEAFPEGYIWMQSNHFDSPNICLTASIAIIPWLKSAFRGFIVGLWLDGKLHRFATYTGAKTDLLKINDEQVNWHMSDRNYQLEITAHRGQTGDLKGPTRQDMNMRVAESLTATLEIKLIDKKGEILFEETGKHAGLEAAGDLTRLLNTE